MTDKKIIIDGVEYNPCNGCKLWNGHHCIGARSYEPNADKHRAICNEHIAEQFNKVYQQLYRKTQECEELKRKVELMMDCADCKVDEYKKALEEIKEILEIHKDDKCAICPKFDECFEHPSCDNIILQKISEIENESK